MKKRMVLILSLISIFLMVAGTAAVPLKSRSIHLTETRFIQGKGVVFLFATTGEFTKSDLDTAFAYSGGQSLDVNCNIKNGMDQIACTVKLVNQYAGQDIVVGLIGQGFWTTVPEKPECIPVSPVTGYFESQQLGTQAIAFTSGFPGGSSPENYTIIVGPVGCNPPGPTNTTIQNIPFVTVVFG